MDSLISKFNLRKKTVWLLGFYLGALTACTNAVTQSSLLGNSFAQLTPTVNSSTTPNILVPIYNSPLNLSGTCTQLSTALQFSFDGGTTWGGLPSGTTDNCATAGTFTYSITDVSQLGIIGGLSSTSLAGASESFQIRNITPLGNTSAATVTISLPPNYNRYLASQPAAGGAMTGQHFKIIGKFGSAISTPILVGSSYKIKLEN